MVTSGYFQGHRDPVFFFPPAAVFIFRLRRYVDIEAEETGSIVEDHFRVGIAILAFQSLLVGLAYGVKGV
ncbi:hypothetical protein AN618_24860 [Fervidicola ferrireducens]|uniref:Uncharacterized protein n=1 Tax=Fervidicola ferrireducens TaxID=520764 RepID=A0A140KZ78_9FIRM|nr:hypothetical protein AN618_24860 [Fervidicola ferrireducens]